MKKCNSFGKKGQLGFEAAWVVIVLVILALGLVFGLQAFNDLNDDIQSDSEMSAVAKDYAQTTVGNAPSSFDGMFFFFFVMLWVFLVIAAYFSTSNPVFLVITIIMMVVALVVTMILSNAYQEASADASVSAFAQNFPKMNWIIDHMLLVVVMMGFSVMMVLYARSGT